MAHVDSPIHSDTESDHRKGSAAQRTKSMLPTFQFGHSRPVSPSVASVGSVSDSEGPEVELLISSILYKRRNGFGKLAIDGSLWQWRLFTLTNTGVLSYYDTGIDFTDPQAKPRGRIDLASITYEIQTEPTFDNAPTKWPLQICPQHEEKWKLCADSAADHEKWCAAIDRFVNLEKPHADQRPAGAYRGSIAQSAEHSAMPSEHSETLGVSSSAFHQPSTHAPSSSSYPPSLPSTTTTNATAATAQSGSQSSVDSAADATPGGPLVSLGAPRHKGPPSSPSADAGGGAAAAAASAAAAAMNSYEMAVGVTAEANIGSPRAVRASGKRQRKVLKVAKAAPTDRALPLQMLACVVALNALLFLLLRHVHARPSALAQTCPSPGSQGAAAIKPVPSSPAGSGTGKTVSEILTPLLSSSSSTPPSCISTSDPGGIDIDAATCLFAVFINAVVIAALSLRGRRIRALTQVHTRMAHTTYTLIILFVH